MAAAEYAALVRKFPDFEQLPQAYFLWAESLRLSRQPHKAAAAFKQMRQRFPNHPQTQLAMVNMAAVLIDQERYDDVLALLTSIAPENTTLKAQEAIDYHIGLAYHKSNNAKAAVRYFIGLAQRPLDEEYKFRLYARLSLAGIHYDLGRLDDAIKLYSELADYRDTPNDIREEVLHKLGEIAYIREEHEKAVDTFKRLLKRYPDGELAAQARANAAWAMLQLERYADIVNLLQPHPGRPLAATPESRYLLALSLKNRTRFVLALEQYRELKRRFPQNDFRAYAEFQTIECLYKLERYRECVDSAVAYVQNFERHEFTPDAYYYLGQSHLALNALDAAAHAYETALARFWEHWAYREDAVLILADTYYKAGRYKQAAAAYRRILKVPDSDGHVQSLNFAGECELLAGDSEAALTDFDRLLDSFPDAQEAPLALLKTAEIFEKRAEYENAIARLTRFFDGFPQHRYAARALYLRGVLYLLRDQNAEAVADLRRSIAQPAFEGEKWARLFLGFALWERDEAEEALQLFAELLKNEELHDSFEPDLLAAIGERYVEQNNMDTAETCFALLSTADDKRTRLKAVLGLGKLEFARNNLDTAADHFSKVNDQSGDFAELRAVALAHLGETLRRLDRIDQATIILDAALDADPEDVRAAAIARLGKARVLHRAGNTGEALRYATGVFFIFQDSIYAPAAGLFAIELSLSLDRKDAARDTYRELELRFPAAVAAYNNHPDTRELLQRVRKQ